MKRLTREIQIGSIAIGAAQPVAVQSMCATKTQDIDATFRQIVQLVESGAQIVRVAVDTRKDVEALQEIARKWRLLDQNLRNKINISVDLQENFRLAELVAPFVAKIRYNPGHLNHTEKETGWREKVQWLIKIARKSDIALRVGVNCGSLDAAHLTGQTAQNPETPHHPMLLSAMEHSLFLEDSGFTRFCVSLKDSDPQQVVKINRIFARNHPHIPLHLGVTEAGMPPEGVWKSRKALGQLLADGIGDTLRISLTVPAERKMEEVIAGKELLADIRAGRRVLSDEWQLSPLNIISCPSCSRVQNSRFIELAEKVRQMTQYAKDFPITIAVMGCRVNGPGETDHADIGLWCGKDLVNLKRKGKIVGAFSYDTILPCLKKEMDILIDDLQNASR